MSWNTKANSIFLDAIEVSSFEDRSAFVERVCGDQPELRREVLELLAAYQQAGAGDFLERAACGDVLTSQGSAAVQDTCDVKNDSSVSVLKRVENGFNTELPTLAEGAQFGRYRIKRVLGRGGMGVVYLAIDTRLKRHVALKVPRFGDQPELVERFEREARTMAAVSHRNLCAIHDVDELNGVRYLSLAFIDGETLAQVLQRGERLPPRRIAELIRKLALATARAHRAGVVHRDLKPANVIIDHEGEPVVMDFGVAHTIEDDARLTQSGCIMGTPAYMAPEQTLGDPSKVGTWSDIYSLGAILYELLAGQPMFAGSASIVISKLLLAQSTPNPNSIRADTDPTLEAICLKAISRRPEDRFESAAAMATALEDYLEGRAVMVVAREGTTRVRECETLVASGAPEHAPVTLGSAAALPSHGKSFFSAWIGVGLLGLLALAAIVVIRMQSPEGTLVAEIDDDAIVAQAQGLKLNIRDTKTNKEYDLTLNGKMSSQMLPAGEYRIEVAEKPSGLRLSDNTFQITRDNMHPAVKVYFEPANSQHVPAPVAEPSAVTLPPSLANHPLLSEEYEWSVPVNVGPGVNSGLGEDHACISSDGLAMFFVRYQDRHLDMWKSQRSNPNEQFQSAERLPLGINTPYTEHCPFLSRDGLTLWFASDRPGGEGADDIYFASRTAATQPFAEPMNLGSPVNSEDDESSPFLTDDGLTIFFGRGAPRKLFQAQRASVKEPFREPLELPNINAAKWNEFPRMFADGLGMIFVSDRNPKVSQQSLWLATRSSLDADFQTPINLGPDINYDMVSGPSLSSDERTLFYSSRREGGHGAFDLWSVTRTAKK